MIVKNKKTQLSHNLFHTLRERFHKRNAIKEFHNLYELEQKTISKEKVEPLKLNEIDSISNWVNTFHHDKSAEDKIFKIIGQFGKSHRSHLYAIMAKCRPAGYPNSFYAFCTIRQCLYGMNAESKRDSKFIITDGYYDIVRF